MGNQICCQQPVSEHNQQQLYQLSSQIEEINSSDNRPTIHTISEPQIHIPQLSPDIISILNENKPFEQEFNFQNHIKNVAFGTDVYQGPLDETQRPTGIGRMYKNNGALYIGQFVSGKAEGPCFYIMKDGSYYRGQMKDNKADCENGKFVSKNFEYTGGFKNNQFHGKGNQKALDRVYLFEGIYENGRKKQGTMKWGKNTFDNIYQGSFDQNGQFTGKGRYTDPQGLYQGQFLNGQKHGFGIYYYNSKLRYEGHYYHNKKQGEGKIVNHDGSIAYKGVFKNGMPNGKGIATSKTGVQFEAEWIDGIDARLL